MATRKWERIKYSSGGETYFLLDEFCYPGVSAKVVLKEESTRKVGARYTFQITNKETGYTLVPMYKHGKWERSWSLGTAKKKAERCVRSESWLQKLEIPILPQAIPEESVTAADNKM